MYEFQFEVQYEGLKQLALIPMVMEVDKQLEPDILTRQIIKKDKSFVIMIKSSDLKRLRAVVAGMFRHLKLIVATIDQFG